MKLPSHDDKVAEDRATPNGAAERAALWDTWEQVEGRSLDEVRAIYRDALRAHGADVRSEALFAFMTVAMVGGSWSGDEVRDGARNLQQRVTTDYRAVRERQEATKPIREQIRREVAAGAAGKTRAEVRAELTTRYDAAGLGRASQTVAAAEAVKIVKLTWREKLLAFRDRRAFLESVMGLSNPPKAARTGARPGQPEWSRPRAHLSPRWVSPVVAVRVELTDDGIETLSRLVAEWEPDAPDHQPVCWLTVGESPADPVVVHLGDRTVGRLDAHASDICRGRVAAAQVGGHRLWDTALLTGDGSTSNPFLLRVRISLPNAGGSST